LWEGEEFSINNSNNNASQEGSPTPQFTNCLPTCSLDQRCGLGPRCSGFQSLTLTLCPRRSLLHAYLPIAMPRYLLRMSAFPPRAPINAAVCAGQSPFWWSPPLLPNFYPAHTSTRAGALTQPRLLPKPQAAANFGLLGLLLRATAGISHVGCLGSVVCKPYNAFPACSRVGGARCRQESVGGSFIKLGIRVYEKLQFHTQEATQPLDVSG
jgi:hypothetical protein